MEQRPGSTPASPKVSSKSVKGGISPGSIVFIVIVAAGIGAYAFWQEDVNGMVALQAWNPGAAKQLIVDFNKTAHSSDTRPLVGMLHPTTFTVTKDDKGNVKSVSWDAGQGRQNKPPAQLLPAGEIKDVDVRLNKQGEQYFFVSLVQFADGKWGQVGATRVNGKLVITYLPGFFDKTKPSKIF